MADLTRAEELVQTLEQDVVFQAKLETAPTILPRRAVLDRHGFQDIGLDDMRAYAESKGGKLVISDYNRELSDDELAAVAGGYGMPATDVYIGVGVGTVIVAAMAAAA